ncbi:MAG: HAMP domain-containing histidine kinase [Planctomycetes bacterium]|nr:HAMP domain-containing histidine kinase [Planctomycetota bacterium]
MDHAKKDLYYHKAMEVSSIGMMAFDISFIDDAEFSCVFTENLYLSNGIIDFYQYLGYSIYKVFKQIEKDWLKRKIEEASSGEEDCISFGIVSFKNSEGLVDIDVNAYLCNDNRTLLVTLRDETKFRSLLNMTDRMTKNISRNLQSIRKERDQALQQIDSEDSNDAASEFTDRAVHDLKGPLATIKGFGEVAKEEIKDSEELKSSPILNYVERMISGTEKLNHLVEDLLEYSKIKNSDIQIEQINLNKILMEVKQLLHEDIIKKRTSITASDIDIAVKGNDTALRIIFQNIISNAIKYSKETEAPKISIRCSTNNNQVSIVFEDNGIGIDESKVDTIMKPFERLGKKKVEGTGLGLAAVKEAVEGLGGSIEVDSKVGIGTSFRVSLRQ